MKLSEMQRKLLAAAPFFGPDTSWQGEGAIIPMSELKALCDGGLLSAEKLLAPYEDYGRNIATGEWMNAKTAPFLMTHAYRTTEAGRRALEEMSDE